MKPLGSAPSLLSLDFINNWWSGACFLVTLVALSNQRLVRTNWTAFLEKSLLTEAAVWLFLRTNTVTPWHRSIYQMFANGVKQIFKTKL